MSPEAVPVDWEIATDEQLTQVVQRGTVHNWVNRGTAPCIIAFSLIAARPVERKGRAFNAMG